MSTQELKQESKVTFDAAELKEMIAEAAAKGAENAKKFAKKAYISDAPVDEAKAEKANKQNEVAKFFNALAQSDRATLTSMSAERAKYIQEGNATTGGYLVPEEFEKSILVKLEDYSIIRSKAQVLPMNTDVKRLNELVTDPTVAYVGEAATISESTPTFGEPVLTARKIAGITSWSAEVNDDAELNVLSLLADRFAERIAYTEQNEFVNGTTSGSEGLLQVSGVATVTMATGSSSFADATFDLLKDMDTELKEYSILESRSAEYFMSPYVWNVISQTKPTNSGYFGGNPVNGWAAQAWGRQVNELNEMPTSSDDAVSTKFIILGDLRRHLFIGDRAGIRVSTTDSATVGSNNLFEQDMAALRVVKRTANTTANEGGIVCLVTAAS